jgi:hypothetical protein
MVDDFDEARDLVRAAKRGAVHLTIGGVDWWVYELPATPMDRRSTPSLVFESEDIVRRLRNYPPEWRDLAEDELVRLMGEIQER